MVMIYMINQYSWRYDNALIEIAYLGPNAPVRLGVSALTTEEMNCQIPIGYAPFYS